MMQVPNFIIDIFLNLYLQDKTKDIMQELANNVIVCHAPL